MVTSLEVIKVEPVDTSRKFDFHDMELFFEFEPPATTAITVTACERPTVSSSRVFDVTKLVPGSEVTIDFDDDAVGDRKIFLVGMNDKKGVREQGWVRMEWQNVHSSN